MLIRLCKYVPCSKHSIVFLCYFVHIRCIFRKISSLQADEYKTRWRPFRTAWVRSANQITRLDNKEIQNINKRPQWVLDEGGPLSRACGRLEFVCSECISSSMLIASKLRRFKKARKAKLNVNLAAVWWPRAAIRVFGVFSSFSFYIIFHFTYLVYFICFISFHSFYFILFCFRKQFIIEVKWNQRKKISLKCNLIQSKIIWKQKKLKATENYNTVA